MTTILDGRAIANKVKSNIKLKVFDFMKNYKRQICLAVILVGNDKASELYVNNKVKACEKTGIKSLVFKFDSKTSTTSDVADLIIKLGKDDSVDGILLQLPLPIGFSKDLINLIPFEKDVDGFSTINAGRIMKNQYDYIMPCTPAGILRLLKETTYEFAGKHAVIVGRSNIVGKPLAQLLLNLDCTVTVCHSKTKRLSEYTSQADILISAVGIPNFITSDMIKYGATVIDVGINNYCGKTVGDVEFDACYTKTAYITPVPGGVGPMTIAMLMKNTYDLALKRENERNTK